MGKENGFIRPVEWPGVNPNSLEITSSPTGRSRRIILRKGSQELGIFGSETTALEIVEDLGAGGQGEVWLIETKLNKGGSYGEKGSYVLKISKPGTERLDLEKELEALVRDNGGVLPKLIVYSIIGHDSGTRIAILEEYLAGPSLKERIAQAKRSGQFLPYSEVLEAFEGVAAGLDRLINKERVVSLAFSDLDPTHIFYSGGRVRLVDPGGVAKLTGGLKYGKEVYAAPECYKPNTVIDQRADIFSLGVGLWEALTGIDPLDSHNKYPRDFFWGQERHRIALAVLRNTLKGRGIVPTEIVQLVERATEQDRENRFQTLGDFKTALGDEAGREFFRKIREKAGQAKGAVRVVLGLLALGSVAFWAKEKIDWSVLANNPGESQGVSIREEGGEIVELVQSQVSSAPEVTATIEVKPKAIVKPENDPQPTTAENKQPDFETIKNGHFWQGLSGWQTGGKVEAIPKPAGEEVEGRPCVRLGIELQPPIDPKTGYKESNNFIEQLFVVPKGASKLKIVSRYVTHDILPWAGVDFTLSGEEGVYTRVERGYNPKNSTSRYFYDSGWEVTQIDISAWRGKVFVLRIAARNKFDGGLGIWAYVRGVWIE